MLRMPKTISALALGVAISAASVVPAHALSLIQPAYETQEQEQAQTSDQRGYPASAFAAGKGEEATPNGYALSQAEINHVKWCATRYTSYHPTDNSYMAAAGTRMQCLSPY
ncbi:MULTISPECIES: BA14K family protein [Agrobacterium]|uniref:BA14K family protein n=1 Tax=Agrobacterium TaxID=357 RepID=UPI000D1D5C36|nr:MULTISPECIES: BA14K family protein [Agrobacterium]